MSDKPIKWVGLGGGPGRRNWAWQHPQLPGLVVRHCGHPTALRPYYVDGLLHELGAYSNLEPAQTAAMLAHAAVEQDPKALEDEELCWRIHQQAYGWEPRSIAECTHRPGVASR